MTTLHPVAIKKDRAAEIAAEHIRSTLRVLNATRKEIIRDFVLGRGTIQELAEKHIKASGNPYSHTFIFTGFHQLPDGDFMKRADVYRFSFFNTVTREYVHFDWDMLSDATQP